MFIPLSLFYSFMAFLDDKYKIIYFGNLKKKMNEKKIEKLFALLRNLRDFTTLILSLISTSYELMASLT